MNAYFIKRVLKLCAKQLKILQQETKRKKKWEKNTTQNNNKVHNNQNVEIKMGKILIKRQTNKMVIYLQYAVYKMNMNI